MTARCPLCGGENRPVSTIAMASGSIAVIGCPCVPASPPRGPVIVISYAMQELFDREIEAVHASMDAKERELDEHGYGGKPR